MPAGNLSEVMLTKQAVDEFKKIYLKKYGVALTDDDAFEKASSLLNLCRTVFSTSDMKKNMNSERPDAHKC